MATKRDYYEVLGISKKCQCWWDKKSFRRAAVEHHPDRGGDEAKFKEINEAYEVLKDPDKRRRYDQFGHAGVGSSAASDDNPFGGGFGQGQSVNFDFGDLGLGDIFGNFFGGGGRRQPQQAQGRDVETRVEISFEQAIFVQKWNYTWILMILVSIAKVQLSSRVTNLKIVTTVAVAAK